MAEPALSMSNPVFANFIFYAALCLLKMIAMAPWTARYRLGKGVFANVEDVQGHYKERAKDKKCIFDDPDVERVRRNHLNDLENIPAFILAGFLYVAVNPAPLTALWHFRVFTISRFLHTICYQFVIPQPSRAMTFMVGLVVTVSMVMQVIMAAM